jgi:acetylornithine/N-succinyldiaminopimelate aminotransferase
MAKKTSSGSGSKSGAKRPVRKVVKKVAAKAKKPIAKKAAPKKVATKKPAVRKATKPSSVVKKTTIKRKSAAKKPSIKTVAYNPVPKKNGVRQKAKPELSAVSKILVEKGRQFYTQNYKPREMIIDRGKGARIWDKDGNEYVDFAAGIAVNGLGNANPKLVKVLTEQAKKLWHTSNVFFNEPAILLAEELVRCSGFAKRVFFCSSGGEANEAAIKIARKYAADKGKPPEARKIISFTGSFHGRTLATVTMTAQPKYQQGFEPVPAGFIYCPFNDREAFANMMGDDVCAVISEVVQGEGGIRPAASGFLKFVQDLCRKHDALLILDQVQCGMGRTGHLFSHFAEEGVVPDIVSLAKGLGGGIPIGASLIGERAADTFQFGNHGSTYGGSPLATAVALEVVKQLQSKTLQKNVVERGKQLVAGLEVLKERYGIFSDIRGRGLMIGAELAAPYKGKAGDLAEHARVQRLLILQAGPDVMRMVPPLVIHEWDIKSGLKRLEFAIQSFLLEQKP